MDEFRRAYKEFSHANKHRVPMFENDGCVLAYDLTSGVVYRDDHESPGSSRVIARSLDAWLGEKVYGAFKALQDYQRKDEGRMIEPK